jgi:hypothetical protein
MYIKGGKLDDEDCLDELANFGVDINATDKEIKQVIKFHKSIKHFGAYDGPY